MAFKFMQDHPYEGAISVEEARPSNHDIAIVGMSVTIGACENYVDLWRALADGADLIGSIPESRKKMAEEILQQEGHFGAAFKEIAYMPRVDSFDYRYFNYSPKEASYLDPAHRLFLQSVVEAIEDAGYGGDRLKGSNTGVFVGYADVQSHSYQRITHVMDPEAIYQYPTANLNSLIAGRVSYYLDLKGPGMIVDTACSSSLVAVHYACQSLRNGECEMAICGGVKVNLLPIQNGLNLGIESPDWRAKTFDQDANGTGGGEGTIALVLKPLEQAIADRDHVHAVIKGSCVNQDGTSAGITAPNLFSQEDVIVGAWEDAGIDPETISYIEAHGTGTKLGDPIEVKAIEQAFSRFTERKQFCALGALKTNVGHLDHAAGIAGLAKAVLCLKYKALPPNLHFRMPNPQISFVESPVYVVDRCQSWISKDESPLRCGISSFGLSGTNCHIVLEEASAIQEPAIAEPAVQIPERHLFTVSAKSKTSLFNLIHKYVRFFKSSPPLPIADVCYTASVGRGHYAFRAAVITDNIQDLIRKLELIADADHDAGEQRDLYVNLSGEMSRLPHLNTIPEFAGFSSMTHEQKAELGRLYVSGIDPDWPSLFAGLPVRSVALPTYAFDDTSCWVQKAEHAAPFDMSGYYYGRKWEPCPLPSRAAIPGNVLFFDHEWAEPLEASLELSSQHVFRLKKASADELASQLENLNRYGATSRIVYLADFAAHDWTTQGPELIYRIIGEITQYLRLMIRKLQHQELALTFVTRNAHQVNSKEDGLVPVNAVAVSLLKALKAEHPHIRLRSVDLGPSESFSTILKETESAPSSPIHIAYRDGIRYMEVLSAIQLPETAIDETKIRPDGVYVVTGGLGFIGSELIRYITAREKVRIIVFQRSLGNFELKSVHSAPGDTPEPLVERLKALLQMTANRSVIEIMRVDVTDEEEVSRALAHVRDKYGGIHGVIHAAGIGAGSKGQKYLLDEGPDELNDMIAPKLDGVVYLDKHTRQDELDFMLLCSSAVSLVGGILVGKYLIANACLDAFSAHRNQQGMKTLSINWPVWRKEAESAEHLDRNQLFKSITPNEARAGLHHLLNRSLSQLVIGQFNWESDIHQIQDTLPYSLSQGLKTQLSNVSKSITVNSPTDSPVRLTGKDYYTETERQLAAIWSSLLGIQEIGVDDTFDSLGGDSILAVRMELELEKAGWRLDDPDILESLTIAELAERIDSSRNVKV